MANSIPVILYDEQEAAESYLAYLGLLAHEVADPALRTNPSWQHLKAIAYTSFEAAFIPQIEVFQ